MARISLLEGEMHGFQVSADPATESDPRGEPALSAPEWGELASLGGLLAVIAVAALLFGFHGSRILSSGSFQHEQGHAYLSAVPFAVTALPDNGPDPQRSNLRLLENGVPLGPAHSAHHAIRTSGQGRFSHWDKWIYFSTSDNSDPRTNGRRYSIEFENRVPELRAWLALVVGGAMMAAAGVAFVARRRRTPRPILGAVAFEMAGGLLLALAVALVLPFDPPTTGPTDVPGYSFSAQAPLTGWDDPSLQRRQGETDLDYAQRMTRTVAEKIYHCEYTSTPRLADWLVSKALDESFRNVGLLTPSALRCGWCNQVSYVLARTLNNAGIEADLLVLNGHVVTVARYAGRRWIADADFGVGPVEYPVSFATVEPAYRRITGIDEAWLAQLSQAYRTTDDDQPYFRSMQWMNDFERRQERMLRWLEGAAWIGGFAGAALLLHGLLAHGRARRHEGHPTS